MRIKIILATGSLLAATQLAWAVPSAGLGEGGNASAPAATTSSAPTVTPAAADKATYAEALALMKQGDGQSAKAAADPAARAAAKTAYEGARAKLRALTARSPDLPEAWNALGYTQRQLGSYDDALASYARALSLRPGYPEALEYRGEAFLRLGRIDDAKDAYLDLFAANRKIAALYLDSIKAWIKQQQAAKGANAAAVADFDHWARERTQIASQTAALTREGTAASWN